MPLPQRRLLWVVTIAGLGLTLPATSVLGQAEYQLMYPTPNTLYANIFVTPARLDLNFINGERMRFVRNPADDAPGYQGYSSGAVRLRWPTRGAGILLQLQNGQWTSQGEVTQAMVQPPRPGFPGGPGFPGPGGPNVNRRNFIDLTNGKSPWWAVRPVFSIQGFTATEIAFVGNEATGEARLAAGERAGPNFRCIYQDGGRNGDRIILSDLRTGQIVATFQVTWQNYDQITWIGGGQVFTFTRMHPK